MSLHSLLYQPERNTLKPYGLWSLNSNLIISHPMYMGFQTVSIHQGAKAASEALTCNQRSACLCQASSANFQLRKDWILGLIFGSLSQEESSGVFLSMECNAFSSPMKESFP